MKNFLSRRSFLKKTSKGLAGAAAISVVGYSFDPYPKVLNSTQQAEKNKSSVSKIVCEFGV
jgi:hypothetical protein